MAGRSTRSLGVEQVRIGSHIELTTTDTGCMVSVWDCELFDYLDDYFVEKDLDRLVAFPGEGVTSYRFYFGTTDSCATILLFLQQLDFAEVDRICLLNNPLLAGRDHDA